MIYESAKAVLASLDAQGDADHDDWVDQVATRLASLEGSYRELLKPARDLIDYSELPTQAAYVFRYVLGHAEFAYDFLRHARDTLKAPLFKSEELWVTSVGGGPGSELLGLLKYLAEEKSEPQVSKIVYTVIDKEKSWEHVAESFISKVDGEVNIELYFQTCDVTAKTLPSAVTLKDEELVFMSFFISEVCALPEKVRVVSNVNSLLSSMKKDALLLYNDSNAYSFYKFMNDRWKSVSTFQQLLEYEGEYKIDAPEYDGSFEEYVDQYDYRPKLSSNAVTKLLRKVS